MPAHAHNLFNRSIVSALALSVLVTSVHVTSQVRQRLGRTDALPPGSAVSGEFLGFADTHKAAIRNASGVGDTHPDTAPPVPGPPEPGAQSEPADPVDPAGAEVVDGRVAAAPADAPAEPARASGQDDSAAGPPRPEPAIPVPTAPAPASTPVAEPLVAEFENEGNDAGAPPTDLPPAQPALDLANASLMPEPVGAGGGDRSLNDILAGDYLQPEPDEQGRNWFRLGWGRPLTGSFNLTQDHVFLVFRTTEEIGRNHGLFGWTDGQYDNFVQMRYGGADGSLSIQGEDQNGTRFGAGIGGGVTAPGQATLLELDPQAEGDQVDVRINGQPAGRIPKNVVMSYFGAGYKRDSRFDGWVGDLRFYREPDFTDADAARVRQLLLARWGIAQGEQPSLLTDGFRSSPGAATPERPVGRSDELTVQVDEFAAPGSTQARSNDDQPQPLLAIGASPADRDLVASGGPRPALFFGRAWNLQFVDAAQATGSMEFVQAETLPAELAGPSGSYTLAWRRNPQSGWVRVARSSAGPEGRITFRRIPLRPGIYGLGLENGVPMVPLSAELLVNDQPVTPDQPLIVDPGRFLRLTLAGANAGQRLVVTDITTRVPVYDGPADALDLRWFANRNAVQTLELRFHPAPGVLGGRRQLTVQLRPDFTPLAPGLLAQVRTDDGSVPPGKFPDASYFTLPDSWRVPGLKPEYADYPPFRTSTSAFTPPLDDITKSWVIYPSYAHTVIPALRLASDEATVQAWRAPASNVVGDLTGGRLVRLSGRLLVRHGGQTRLRLTSSYNSVLRIGERTAAVEVAAPRTGDDGQPVPPPLPAPTEFTLDLAPGSHELEMFSRIVSGDHAPGILLEWRLPGTQDFVPVPESAFVHPVEPVRDQALARLQGGTPQRSFVVSPSKDDSAQVAALADFDPAASVGDGQTFVTAVRSWVDAFQNGRHLGGDPRAAHAALALIQAREDFLRVPANRGQLNVGGFSKTDSRAVQLLVDLRPFFWALENHPQLQAEAAEARGQLAGYVLATCLFRSAYGEHCDGANDGFNDNDNLLVNFWRAASALDDPYTWDMATLLQDAHFAYHPGVNIGMSADGIYSFHIANGRQAHQAGYGMTWMGRIGNSDGLGNRLGSPWGFTPEQLRRMLDFQLANEWLTYRDRRAIPVGGRYLGRESDVRGLNWLWNRLKDLPEGAVRPQDLTRARELAERVAASPDNSITGNHLFYRHLIMVHRRADFCIHVKANCSNAGPTETFRGMHPWDMLMSEGLTILDTDGRDYDGLHASAANPAFASHFYFNEGTGVLADNFKSFANGAPDFAYWHYRQLPGTTVLDQELISFDRYRGGSGPNAGGASDGQFGHLGWHYADGLSGSNAAKLYAFLDDGMAQLVNSINSTAATVPDGVVMRTNLNQCDWRGEVVVINQNGQRHAIAADAADTHLRLPLDQRYWIQHAGIGYLVLPTGAERGDGKPGELCLDLTVRTALTPVPGWTPSEAFAQAVRDRGLAERRQRVFHLSIDHGFPVANGQAIYAVCLSGADQKAQQWLTNPPVEILANAYGIQALRERSTGIVHAYFRQPGVLADSRNQPCFEVATPAALMWNPRTASLSVQDPAAATGNTEAHLRQLEATLGPGLDPRIQASTFVRVPLQGMSDPDDRYRGAPATHRLDEIRADPATRTRRPAEADPMAPRKN